MIEKVEVNIIIPTFNRANLLKYTLDSLAESKHPGVKLGVIVVDDGSTDNTETFVTSSYPDVLYLKNMKKGAGSALNTGLAGATAPYVVCLDSDVLIVEGFFIQKIKFLNKSPETDICYGDELLFEGATTYQAGKKLFKHAYPVIESQDKLADHFRNFMSGKYIHPSTIVWRKSLLINIGGHDESLNINQDVELFFRALFNNAVIKGIADGTTVYTRQHNSDNRVGNAGKNSEKWMQILELRLQIYRKLKTKGITDISYYSALSFFLFRHWKKIRHWDKEVAKHYLQLAMKIHWPVELTGNAGFRLLGRLIGPDKAVMLKYFLLRRV